LFIFLGPLPCLISRSKPTKYRSTSCRERPPPLPFVIAATARQSCMGRRPNEGPGRARPGGRPGSRRPQSVPDAPGDVREGTKPGSVSAASTHSQKKNTVGGGAEIHCTSLLISKKKYWVSLALPIKEAVCFLRNLEEGPPHQYLPNFPFRFFYCTVTFFCWQEEIICNNISKHLNARPYSLF
jgi:hypothetical protein